MIKKCSYCGVVMDSINNKVFACPICKRIK